MGSFTFDKALQGRNFRVEVAYVAPPRVTLAPPTPDENPPSGPLIVGEKLMIETDVLGFPTGTSVDFSVYEPCKMHESAVHTASGKTEEETRGVSVEWTFDWQANKDKVSSTRFVCVARVGKLTSISEPFEVLQRFQRTLQGKDGAKLPRVRVLLRAPRRADIAAETDDEGKLDLCVPPGDYLIEILGPRR
ncbi:MAG: hypothetical protein AB7N76_04250 [Planctomycetota bacterium]